MWSVLWLAAFFLATLVFADEKVRSFTVDYSQNRFLKDGKPFSFIAGDLHYFRVPRPYWRDRLTKMRAAGVDTLTTYINWEFHEPSPGKYHFSGQKDFIEFFRIAKELDFNIILRPGPYITAEWDLGGYPSWMLTMYPDILLRTLDPRHTSLVKRWLDELMPRVVPLLYGNGGNIIMVQVENEFGWSQYDDKRYQKWLYDLLYSYVKNLAVLFTNDTPSGLKNGTLPGVLQTLDFGPSDSPMENFNQLREYQPNGPLAVMEFYVGFLTLWGQGWSIVRTESVVPNIETFLQNNVSFSMYMFHGGTNFAFSAGSNTENEFDITSYDYDAPISEAGDLTPKYMAIKEAIKKYRTVDDLPAPAPIPKGNYGELHLKPVCPLFRCSIGIEYPSSEWPVTFEALGQKFGFVSYSTTLDRDSSEPSRLQAIVRDRTTVYLDDKDVGVMQGEMSEVVLPSSSDAGRSLRLLVENMGHRTQLINEKRPKGLISNATIDGKLLSNWKITGYPLNPEDIAKLKYMDFDEEKISFPAVFRGSLTLGKGETPLDTFLSMEDWGKGVVFVNEYNLGRYWEIGPQVTLYVPATFLREFPASNIVTIMELYKTHPNRTITFLQNPIIKGNFTYWFDI